MAVAGVKSLQRYIVEARRTSERFHCRPYAVASGFDDRAKITILDACERCTRSQELRQRGSQQEGDDREKRCLKIHSALDEGAVQFSLVSEAALVVVVL